MSQEAASAEDGDEGSEDDDLSIYHTLLSLYLKPAPPQKPKLVPALGLLSKHGSRLPAASTLGLIPDDLPVDERVARADAPEEDDVARGGRVWVERRLSLRASARGKQGWWFDARACCRHQWSALKLYACTAREIKQGVP